VHSGSAPDIISFPYAGWVPTANGRLSFRHIGETRHPSPAIYANIASDARRYILAFQRRNLSDSAFRSITDYICGVSGDFWFAIAATSTEAPDHLGAAINGKIFIFKSKEDWRNGPGDTVRLAIERLNNDRFSLDGNRVERTERDYVSAKDALVAHADIFLAFELRRTGEVYVSEPTFSDPDLEYASASLANEGGHDFQKWIADQSYFFLRDIIHQHQHHEPHVDTILTLQKRTLDEAAWRQHILFSLHYYIISARRTRHPPVLIQAIGVLAYCRSFVGVCRTAGYDNDQLPQFETEAIETSLRSSIDENSYSIAEQERSGVRVWNARLTLIAILAPVLALTGVFVQPRIGTEDGIRRFPDLNRASDFLSENFSAVLGLLVLLFVFSWSLTSLLPSLSKAPSGKDVLRLGLVNHYGSAAISAVIGVLAAAFGIYFGWDALKSILGPFYSITMSLTEAIGRK